MNDFKFTHFSKKDIPKMYKAFNAAFSDYLVPMKMSESAFRRKLVQKTNIKFKQSIGCYYEKELVGFILHAVDQYEGKKVAYNGGTGVIPAFRGNNLTFRMYEHILPGLVKKGVERCVLEVVSTNLPAIRSYEKIGFRKSKFFHCLKLDLESQYLKGNKTDNFRFVETNKPKWKTYPDFCDHSASFLDSLEILKKSKAGEHVIEAYDGDKMIGYIIFNRKMGRIEHLAVDKPFRGRSIGSMLVKKMHQRCRYKPIYILNVNERSYDILSFFLRIGFINDLDQFELSLNVHELS